LATGKYFAVSSLRGKLGGLHALQGMARLDPFDADPQPQPPDGEFAQVVLLVAATSP
jgi:hypothetical protein